MQMLNLNDPPEPTASETRSHQRLVVSGRPMVFSVPVNSEVPWWVRVVGVTIGIIISCTTVLGIIYFGSFIQHVYRIIDARQKARAEQRRLAPDLQKGTVFIVVPKDRPAADDAEPEDEPAGVPPT